MRVFSHPSYIDLTILTDEWFTMPDQVRAGIISMALCHDVLSFCHNLKFTPAQWSFAKQLIPKMRRWRLPRPQSYHGRKVHTNHQHKEI